jgi:hypothetical protein
MKAKTFLELIRDDCDYKHNAIVKFYSQPFTKEMLEGEVFEHVKFVTTFYGYDCDRGYEYETHGGLQTLMIYTWKNEWYWFVREIDYPNANHSQIVGVKFETLNDFLALCRMTGMEMEFVNGSPMVVEQRIT